MASFHTKRHSEAVSRFQTPGVLEKLYVLRIGSDAAGCYLIAPGNHGSGLLFRVLLESWCALGKDLCALRACLHENTALV